MRKLLYLFLLLSTIVHADTVSLPTTYSVNGQVTSTNLNGNFNSLASTINGGLDNNNANTSSGYRFYEIKSSLPTNGSQGRVVFNTADNSLNIDNGSNWQSAVFPSGTLATGKIPIYNSGWGLLTPGTQYYSLVSNGISSLPSYQQVSLTQGVTGTLAISNGGTGSTTASDAINALLPTQSGNSGKFLTTNGSTASWGSAGLKLVSTTTMSAVTNSGDIAIDSSKQYKVILYVTTFSSADSVGIRINNNTGASAYEYINRGFDFTATASNANSGGASSIVLTPTASNLGASQYSSEFIIFKEDSSNISYISGRTMLKFNSSSQRGYVDFSGTGSPSAGSRTSFRLITTGGNNMTGTVYLYEMTQ